VNNAIPQCARCETKKCRDGIDCFSQASEHKRLYEDTDISKLHVAASAIEARHYGKETRLGEIILFAKELGYTRVGLAFCIGLSEEAKTIDKILSQHFEVVSVCCKACALEKKILTWKKFLQMNMRLCVIRQARQACLIRREPN